MAIEPYARPASNCRNAEARAYQNKEGLSAMQGEESKGTGLEGFLLRNSLLDYGRTLSLLNKPTGASLNAKRFQEWRLNSASVSYRNRGANFLTVECDETHPSCGACQRHNVPCQYGENIVHLDPSSARARNNQSNENSTSKQLLLSQQDSVSRERLSPSGINEEQYVDLGNPESPMLSSSVAETGVRLLELRLLHHFTAFTSLTFSPAGLELWQKIAPEFAISYEYLLDTIFAVAALHLSRLHPNEDDLSNVSRRYFLKALEGQSRALVNVHGQHMAEGLFLTSILITFHAFVLSGTEYEDPGGESLEPIRWLRICSSGRVVYETCKPHFAPRSKALDAVFLSQPNLTDGNILFASSNLGVLEPLLEWGTDFESISEIDKDAYEKAASYIGLIFKMAGQGLEEPLSSYRRILSMPSRCPERFLELVEERRPRALAILAHLFAALKIVKTDPWWTSGIAERQVGIIQDLLPKGWRTMIELPLQLVSH